MPSEITTDHDVIKKWIEDRGGHPSVVRATEGKRPTRSKTGGGLLRVEFRDPNDALDDVDWEGFFEVFEENKLAFLHYDRRKDGQISQFSRFLFRDAENARTNADGTQASRSHGKAEGAASPTRKTHKAAAKPKAEPKPKAAPKPKASAKK